MISKPHFPCELLSSQARVDLAVVSNICWALPLLGRSAFVSNCLARYNGWFLLSIHLTWNYKFCIKRIWNHVLSCQLSEHISVDFFQNKNDPDSDLRLSLTAVRTNNNTGVSDTIICFMRQVNVERNTQTGLLYSMRRGNKLPLYCCLIMHLRLKCRFMKCTARRTFPPAKENTFYGANPLTLRKPSLVIFKQWRLVTVS